MASPETPATTSPAGTLPPLLPRGHPAIPLYEAFNRSRQEICNRWPGCWERSMETVPSGHGEVQVERIKLNVDGTCESQDIPWRMDDDSEPEDEGIDCNDEPTQHCRSYRALADAEENWADTLLFARLVVPDLAAPRDGFDCLRGVSGTDPARWTYIASSCGRSYTQTLNKYKTMYNEFIRDMRQAHPEEALVEPGRASLDNDEDWPEHLQMVHVRQEDEETGNKTVHDMTDEELFTKAIEGLSVTSHAIGSAVSLFKGLMVRYGEFHLVDDATAQGASEAVGNVDDQSREAMIPTLTNEAESNQ